MAAFCRFRFPCLVWVVNSSKLSLPRAQTQGFLEDQHLKKPYCKSQDLRVGQVQVRDGFHLVVAWRYHLRLVVFGDLLVAHHANEAIQAGFPEQCTKVVLKLRTNLRFGR